MLKFLSVVFSFLVGVQCDFVVLGKRGNPPPGFTRIGSTPATETISLRFALSQSNIQALQDTVYDISTPGNLRYGQYLTQAEVAQFVAPSKETVSQVNSWLASSNLTSSPITLAGDWISVNMTVAQANTLLAADFATFQNADANQTVVRTLSYSIPSVLKANIEWVHPTISFPDAKSAGQPSFANKRSGATVARPPTGSISSGCHAGLSWTVACLLELYGIPSTPAKPAANLFGVSGFQNNFANKLDLKTFLETYRPDMDPNTTFDLISVDGGINDQLPTNAGFFGGNPDVEVAVGLATGVPVTFISTGTLPNDLATELLDQAHYLLSLEHPPQTILNTEILGLENQENEVSPQMAVSLCNVYAQLAARGVSYIVQTGIWGAGGAPGPFCSAFSPPFPATCPFVTAVGATEFTGDERRETAAALSGGGFSDFFERPRYQDAAVSAYLKATNNRNTTAFNVSGRAVPDVSAIFSVDWIWDQGVRDGENSTSFSAAIFASMVARLTNERIAAGRPALGFLNPLIYSHPEAFNDMKTGSGFGCAGFTPGFNITSGWDPVSGLGSPSYPKLQEICSKL